MHIRSIAVRNFRLLSRVDVSLAASNAGGDEAPEVTTVIVGRNNSGKTSFAEIFRRFERPSRFQLEDFSSSTYPGFCDAYKAYLENAVDQGPARAAMPFIELRIVVAYDPTQAEYGPLADFIVDLDETAEEAVVVARFELGKGKLGELFEGMQPGADDDAAKSAFLAELRPRVSQHFKRTLRAEDPKDDTNTRELEWSYFEKLFMIGFVSAQRGLDDVTDREVDVLAHLVEQLFEAADGPDAPLEQQGVVEQLRSVVGEVQTQLDSAFKDQMNDLLPTLDEFGYPGLDGPPIQPVVTLVVEKLLQNSTKMRYAGYLGVALPESYSGLGTRNLLAILLQLLAFQRTFVARGDGGGINLVFVEEPEAHLHPQMQEVFIRQLNGLAKAIGDTPAWSAQFVVTTHSSHIANQAPFTSIRYLLAAPESMTPLVRSTRVKDLSADIEGLNQHFLHQYLTLTRCDLFFADRAILVEGTAERLLLPAMIKRIDGLPSRYVTLLEVGGAYAHRFFPLLDFLELPALVITDIDSVGENQKRELVAEGKRTSNATIKSWFANKEISPQELLGVRDQDKIHRSRRLAYQVPEEDGGSCGRTFEDAFILANRDLFEEELQGAADPAATAAEIAGKGAKSAFALQYAIERTEWQVPSYILEGLQWLHALGPEAEPPGQTAVT
jgi:putative ATP-dependent endonuclease of OLD family